MANGDVHLIWKLKGTGKHERMKTIDSRTKQQPVFITSDLKFVQLNVITENGDELESNKPMPSSIISMSKNFNIIFTSNPSSVSWKNLASEFS